MGAVAAVATTVAAAVSTVSTLTQKKPKAPAAPTPPPPPDPAVAQSEQQDVAATALKRRNKGSGGVPPATLLTGGQGLTAPAPTERKTLLGQ